MVPKQEGGRKGDQILKKKSNNCWGEMGMTLSLSMKIFEVTILVSAPIVETPKAEREKPVRSVAEQADGRRGCLVRKSPAGHRQVPRYIFHGKMQKK